MVVSVGKGIGGVQVKVGLGPPLRLWGVGVEAGEEGQYNGCCIREGQLSLFGKPNNFLEGFRSRLSAFELPSISTP